MNSGRILVIDDEESLRFTFAAFLEDSGFEVDTADSFLAARDLLDHKPYDLIFLDILLGRENGLDLLRQINERPAACPVVMITGAPEIETAAEAVRRGAFDYIPKPVRQTTLLRVAKMALRHKAIVDQRERYRSHLDAIFCNAREGIFLIDREQTVLECNDSASRMFLLDKNCKGGSLERLPGALGRALQELVHRTLSTGSPEEIPRLEMVLAGARPKVFKVTAAPWKLADGEARGAVVIAYDETRLDHLERDLKQRQEFAHIIGRSPKIQAVFELVENLAAVDTTVLVTGESGTGKELVADALHFHSARREGPLVKVNCAALPENLLESELFGHLKGSFTGAIKDKIGRFQQADGGTIFLDEIGDIPAATQVRLLRVLQNKQIEKVGANQPFKVDVRIVAATNQNLLQKVRQGEFREDLYYRLRVVEVAVPPLRERREDIPLLVEHFVGRFNERFGRQVRGLTEKALALMIGYDWPGNIRELEHAIERAFVISRQPTIDSVDLPPELQTGQADEEMSAAASLDIGQIIEALKRAGGNKSKAARLLGVSRRTIYRKIDEYGIDAPDES
jgi:DNA-binding NtrC family response regulator